MTIQQLVAGNQHFAWNLYGIMRNHAGNLFCSPFSISLALAMTYAGARGETAREMAETLHFTLPEAQLHPAFEQLTRDLTQQEQFDLTIANALWGQTDYPFLPEFLTLLAQQYEAGLRLLDFRADTEAARQTINAWVSEQTEEKIKELIPQGLLDRNARLVLTNAIYFYGKWSSPFKKARTWDGAFHRLDSGEVIVPMMHQEERFRYGSGENYEAVELPYADGGMAMIVLLPAEGQFRSVEARLDTALVETVLQGLQPQMVALALPKFSYASEFTLADALSDLGMRSAFAPGEADFSGMSHRHDLAISEVIHKAFVAVDEEGTEAAAATAVMLRSASFTIPNVKFTVDRPFLFLIRDSRTGTILFVGRVLDPSSP